jgi:ketosteroid isomerase-like protein
MINRNHPAFKNGAEPFYSIIMKGLDGEVDGAHFWDAIAEDAMFEFLYRFPGFTTKIEGRKAYMDWFSGYSMVLHSADNLKIHKSTEAGVIILEYQVHGATLANRPYDNSFCSIITIKDRKIVYWRDYMDSLAVMLATSSA